MAPQARTRRLTPAAARPAFTLVELVTAASLMTVMMLGVVQVFAIITQTAADAEGLHFAHQQMRAMFDRLHNDLRGMTREGYLRIRHTANGNYSLDTLAFVTVGPCSSAWASPPVQGSAAEVVYTNNVWTPDALLAVKYGMGSPKRVDERKGVLGRGQWMMAGQSGANAMDNEDGSRAAYLCQMFASQVPLGTTGIDRITLAQGYQLKVWPWLSVAGVSEQPASLKRVMASCVSEFYVEYFNPTTETMQSLLAGATQSYYWSSKAEAATLKGWPRALRVTVAVHDPSDTKPLATGLTRFRGFALQETFWITDP